MNCNSLYDDNDGVIEEGGEYEEAAMSDYAIVYDPKRDMLQLWDGPLLLRQGSRSRGLTVG